MHDDDEDSKIWIFIFPCPYCNSQDTVWNGKRYAKSGIKSTRKCKTCGRGYTNHPPRAKGKKNPIKTINLAIDIAKDHSLRETEKILKEKYGIKITFASIANWKKEFMVVPKKEGIIIKDSKEDDPDWMYKPMLKTNTRIGTDGNKIEAEWMP